MISILLTEYGESMVKQHNTGWGCGYVLLTPDEPFYNYRRQKGSTEESGIREEVRKATNVDITFDESIRQTDGSLIRKIGFDTGQPYHGPTRNNIEWVMERTIWLYNYISDHNRQMREAA